MNEELTPESSNGQISREVSVNMVNESLAIRDAILAAPVKYKNATGKDVAFNMSTEVSFSLENMKNFISYIESHGDKYGNLGVRAYMAAITEKEDELTSTIIFVPTGYDLDGGDPSTSPNIPEANSLNHGQDCMPPYNNILTNP
jgi:hypothetical protein